MKRTAKQIREQEARELGDIIDATSEQEPLDEEECCRQAGDLARRLGHIADATEKFSEPVTRSDVATFREVIAFLDRLANNGPDTTESLRAGLAREERTAEQRRKRLQEWLTR